MAKVKVPRKSTLVDMTAMCDVAFLLLTFFMLTTKMKSNDAVVVDTPSSISEIKLPEADIMTITVDKEGKVFFGIDGKFNRERLIDKVAEKFQFQFTDDEKYQFSLISNFGIPMSKLKSFLGLTPAERDKIKQPGIPCDSTLNELGYWVIYGRLSNPKFRIAIRGDQDCAYPVIQRVMNTLQDKNVNKFNLITDLEVRPS